ncbi:MAG: hypothetical protein HDR43_00670 [Mycoplasma sp.]|nr:hypothetical protein [Mycoplasma sp.]
MKFKKIFFKSLLFFVLLAPVYIIANKEKTIDFVLNQISKNIVDDAIYPNAKVDPLYEVKTIRKTGNDADKINLLLLGDNYDKSDSTEQFSSYAFSSIVTPWLSTKLPSDYKETQSESTRGTRVPFETFLNDKINVYSIQPNYKKSSTIVNSYDTFFGMYTATNNDNSSIRTSQHGEIKKNVLQYDISNNFLEDGGIVGKNSIGLIRYYGSGRANANLLSGYRATTLSGTAAHIHEMGHAIWGLVDEYDESGKTPGQGVNRKYILDTSEENIPWKEFLNFRGVGLKQTATTNSYIPASECVMRSTYSVNDFCEVCTHHIIVTTAKGLQEQLFYIADPELTPHEGRPRYNDEYNVFNPYTVDNLQEMELYKNNVSEANNKHLEFRTVIDNFTTKTRNIKLRVLIKGLNNNIKFKEESDIYTIKPGELKGLFLITQNAAPNNLVNWADEIIGEVIDADTQEVLATSLDRLNYHLLSKNYNGDSNRGKRNYKVTINFKDNQGNSIPNVKPTTLLKREGEKFKLEKILFNGYKLDLNKSQINDEEITMQKSDLTYTYYYDKLNYKNLKLKLIDPNDSNKIIQEKLVKVYEGQKFVPKSSDFFLYDLEKLTKENSDYNQTWQHSVEAPNTIYGYNDINDNSTELVYNIKNHDSLYHLSKNLEIIQGDENYVFKYQPYTEAFNSISFDSDFSGYQYTPSIIYNSVDVNTPGDYELVYFYRGKISDIDIDPSCINTIKIKVIKNDDVDHNLDIAKSETNRLNYIDYVIINNLEYEEGDINDFENINQQNLLSNIKNFNLSDKFNYEIVDFSKQYPGIGGAVFYSYKFKVKVTSKTKGTSYTTNYFEKTIWLKDDTSIVPPVLIEIQNEVDRINKLNLQLNNKNLTQSEANSINQQNILSKISNWVETSGFAYEVINFNNSNNQVKFNIKVNKDNQSLTSKEFVLLYTLIQEPEDENILLDNEIIRINSLSNSIDLNKNTFTQDELNKIIESNFKNQISNWNIIAKNTNKYNYEVANFSKDNNQFIFNIKISLIGDSSLFKTSNQFILTYKLNNEVDQELINEQNRINSLKIKFSKTDFNQFEINDINNDNSKIVNYLDGLDLDNNFNYDYEIAISKNEMILKIKIIKKETGNYLTSNEFKLNYVFIENNNGENNNNDNALPIILASTLTPIGVIGIAAGTGGVIWLKKNKRKY